MTDLDTTDFRLATHRCVWCGNRLADDCPDDLFCKWLCQHDWHEHANGRGGGGSAQPWTVADMTVAPPGAVPDNPAAEPWWVPNFGSRTAATQEEKLWRLLGGAGPGLLAPPPGRSPWFGAAPRLGEREVDDCRWALVEIPATYPGQVCALPGCPGNAGVWYLLAAPMVWLGWLWEPADNEALRLGLCHDHSDVLEHAMLADPERRVDIGVYTSDDRRLARFAVA
jgi:hypothetical protein